MNAPATPSAVVDTAIELIPFDNIRPSRTHIQELRRKRFTQQALHELAQSIREIGMQQPIVVRPVQPDGTIRFEIVFGERRHIASDIAGKAHTPCIVRDLTDEQVLIAQIVENKQREELNDLEEAVGYQDLKDLKGHTPERIGELIGKSESYVRARMRLLTLCPPARDRLASGAIDFSRALVIARYRSAKLQEKALSFLDRYGEIPYSRAFSLLRENFMASLSDAPFKLDQPVHFTFKPSRGDSVTRDIGDRSVCATCPHNSANDAELQHDLDDAHVCTDRPCFELKSKYYWGSVRTAAEAAGRTILSGKDGEAAIPASYYHGISAQHLDLDASPPDGKALGGTYREILGADAPAGLFAEERGGRLHELVPVREAAKLLKAKGIKIDVPGQAGTTTFDRENEADRVARLAEQKKEEERRQVEGEFRKRLFHAIHAKWKGPLKRVDLERIATEFEDRGVTVALNDLYPGEGDFFTSKSTDDDLTRFIVCFLIADDVDAYRDDKPAKLLEVAGRLKIDAKAIRTQVVKDLKPVSVATTDDAPAKKAAKKKPAAKK